MSGIDGERGSDECEYWTGEMKQEAWIGVIEKCIVERGSGKEILPDGN